MISIDTPPQLPGKPSQLLVLGERGVFCCLDTGQLRFMMKLEVTPRCAYPYGVVPPSECTLVGQWCVLYMYMYMYVGRVSPSSQFTRLGTQVCLSF